jgi:hypothetical protein
MESKKPTPTDDAWDELCKASDDAKANVQELYSTKNMLRHNKRESRFKSRAKESTPNEFQERADSIAAQQYPAEIAWLRNYKGTFPFYLDLRNQFDRRGSLSEGQWASLTKAVERDRARLPKPASAPRTFTIKEGEKIIVSKWAANKVAREAGCTFPHFGLEVVKVLDETEKAYKLEVKLAAMRTSRCCVCGLKLTNAQSVEEGIGPICADRWNILKGDALKQLAEKLREFRNVTTWLPKSTVKERLSE